MGKMIRFGFSKLLRRMSFYVVAAIGAGLVVLNAVSYKAMESFDMGDLAIDLDYTGWKFAASAISNSSLTILLAIFVSLFVCSEFEEGTIKNIYARGYSREGVYVSTYLVSLIGSLVIYFVEVAACFATATLLWKVGDVGMYAASIAVQALLTVAYHTLFYAVAAIISRGGISIAISIVIPMVASIGTMLLDGLMKTSPVKASDFWIDTYLTKAQAPADASQLWLCCGVALAYTAVLFIVGIAINKTKEV